MAKKQNISLRIAVILCAVLTIFAAFFAVMWVRTGSGNQDKLEKLCTMSAAYAADAMDAYVSKGEEASYRSAVADYDVFLCIYYTLYGEDDGALADYMTCFEVYRYLLTSSETAKDDLHDFAHILEELSGDPRSAAAMSEMAELRDRIKEAAESGVPVTDTDDTADTEPVTETESEAS